MQLWTVLESDLLNFNQLFDLNMDETSWDRQRQDANMRNLVASTYIHRTIVLGDSPFRKQVSVYATKHNISIIIIKDFELKINIFL